MINLTQTHVSFLSAIDSKFTIDNSEKHDIEIISLDEFNVNIIRVILSKIIVKGNWVISPIFYSSENKPYLMLSEPFLVNNNSNPKLIFNYLKSQSNKSEFKIIKNKDVSLKFEFKKVTILKSNEH
jgi:hypothetical protein